MLKRYNEFITEGLRGKLKANSVETIKQRLSQMNIVEWIREVRHLKLDDSYLPPDEDIKKHLNKLSIDDRLRFISINDLDGKYMPLDEEIENYLSNVTLEHRIRFVKNFGLDKFMPSDDEIRECLSVYGLTTWFSQVDSLGLDKKFYPDDVTMKERLMEYDIVRMFDIIKKYKLDDKFLPSDDEIYKRFSKMDITSRIEAVVVTDIDDKFLPSDNEIKTYLSKFESDISSSEWLEQIKELAEYEIYDWIGKVNDDELGEEYLPSETQIKKWLAEFDLEDWINNVNNLELDSTKYYPPNKEIVEYVISNTSVQIVDDKFKFSDWSVWSELFKKDSNIRDNGYVESVLSGDGDFTIHENIKADGFDFSDNNIFQEIKTEIRAKIEEFTDEEDYEEMITEFDSSNTFSKMYDVINEYGFLEDIKDDIDRAYTSAKESADYSEAYNYFQEQITDMFCKEGGEILYMNNYFMPCNYPDLDADEVIEDFRVIEWDVPHYGWDGEVDDEDFKECILSQLS